MFPSHYVDFWAKHRFGCIRDMSLINSTTFGFLIMNLMVEIHHDLCPQEYMEVHVFLSWISHVSYFFYLIGYNYYLRVQDASTKFSQFTKWYKTFKFLTQKVKIISEEVSSVK